MTTGFGTSPAAKGTKRETVEMGHSEPSDVGATTHAHPSVLTVIGTNGERRRDRLDTDRRGLESFGPRADIRSPSRAALHTDKPKLERLWSGRH